MPSLPSISIVVPSLNQAAYLDQAISSVLMQGYPRLELIVMDGGSTDGTRAILERHASGLTHWQSAPDEGPAAALRAGCALAGGEILGVLNADDFYLPNAFAAIAHEWSRRPDADVIAGHGYLARPDGTLGVPAYSDPWDARRFRHGACVLMQPSTFVRRAAYLRAGGFDSAWRWCWDAELWARLSASGAVFHGVDAFLAAFRLHDASITGRGDLVARRRRDARAVFERLAGRPDTAAERFQHFCHRASKVLRHPGRMMRQRLFVYSTLGRWSL